MGRFMIVVTCVVLVAACGPSEPDTAATTDTPPATTTTQSTSTATTSTTEPPPTTTTSTTQPPPTTTTTTSTTTTTTTTVPPDTTPPDLTVTDPARNATVTTRTYRFRGTTDPGCTVTAAGRYQADVDADGDWSIVLVLNPGSNVATFAATDPAGNTTTVRWPVIYTPPAPDHYRYDGKLIREDAGTRSTVVDRAVSGAWDDLMGGVFYTHGAEGPPGVYWLQAGTKWPLLTLRTAPEAIGVRHGEPTVFFFEYRSANEGIWLVAHSLTTGREADLIEGLSIADVGTRVSVGGGLILGVSWYQVGPHGTSGAIRFWDMDGHPVDVAHNPFPESCAPCELAARLSPDGTRLAYRYRSDAYTPESEHYDPVWSVWWEASQAVHAEFVVIDLATGTQLWHTVGAADTALGDFDGEYVVIETLPETEFDTTASRLYAIDGNGGPWDVTGRVTLLRDPVASPSDIEPHLVWLRSSHSPDEALTTVGHDYTHGRFSFLAGADSGQRKALWTSAGGTHWYAASLPRSLTDETVRDMADADFGYILTLAADRGPMLLIGSGGPWFEADLGVSDGWMVGSVEVVGGPIGALVSLAGGVSNASVEEEVLWTGDGATFESVIEAGNVPWSGGGALHIAGDGSRFVVLVQQRVMPPDASGPIEDWPVEHEVLASTDGTTWRTATTTPFSGIPDAASLWVRDLATAGSVAVAVASDTRYTETRLLRSTDLVHWTDVTPPAAAGSWGVELAAGPAGWLLELISGDTTRVWFSADARLWHEIGPPIDVGSFDLADKWAVGEDRIVYRRGIPEPGAGWTWTASPIGF